MWIPKGLGADKPRYDTIVAASRISTTQQRLLKDNGKRPCSWLTFESPPEAHFWDREDKNEEEGKGMVGDGVGNDSNPNKVSGREKRVERLARPLTPLSPGASPRWPVKLRVPGVVIGSPPEVCWTLGLREPPAVHFAGRPWAVLALPYSAFRSQRRRRFKICGGFSVAGDFSSRRRISPELPQVTFVTADSVEFSLGAAVFSVQSPARQIWQPKQRKVTKLTETVELLQKKFNYCRSSLVARSDVKFAFKLARNAIVLQKSRPSESNHVRNLKETCPICQEERDQDKMFPIDGCRYKYCFSCMKQHIEAKLFNGMVPKCPHETCKSELNIDSCGKFLMPKHIEIMKEWIREISMPVAERVYCPYPKCSVLMSKSEASDFARKENVSRRLLEPGNCYGLFCDNCKVPWHKNMTCKEYKRSNPCAYAEDAKLNSLATRNLWRQCVKCNHMIELAEGCYHMTCRYFLLPLLYSFCDVRIWPGNFGLSQNIPKRDSLVNDKQ
ncbi:LOW QUALITY PROTEIN: hypothetical protein Cgig2_003875 [Carnegiea gigantea]|uniref:RBR-type E3 ubiquitin transferase n=1 Tax=Carnegiea gigantea TaxID=171969 RepID=A0A9Q1JKH2_9CARY|nr:LOW QUALITY PROTEIN: hypothetical protein Cgig2_003875 [Carnegiea gigantea]